MDGADIDPSFEPLQRARSNTWPLPRPENYVDKEEGDQGATLLPDGSKPPDAGHLPKKNSSRRNAWGNMSYADLITQAIQSSPDKRLTLSQIYDWMVQNVPFFKDKGDSNSSAGWKNSIRHNLSLHNRFMRVQNEGTGKSSWWMINPDAKPGKAARRRATSMETQNYEKKRGRIRKKVEALRNGLDTTPSPSSSVSECLDVLPDSPIHTGFQLSPDFRPRASSNASSCGRLSPIPALDSAMHDSQSPMSPIPWGSELGSTGNLSSLYGSGALDRYGADQLVDTLTETMKLGSENAFLTDCGLKTSPGGQLSPHGGGGSGGGGSGATHLHTLQPASAQHGGTNGYSMFSSQGSTYPSFQTTFQNHNEARKLSPQRLMADSLTIIPALSPAHSVHSLSPPQSVDSLPPSSAQQPRAPPTEPVLSPHSSAYPSSANTSPSAYCALSPPGVAASGPIPSPGGQQAAPSPTDMMRAALNGGGGGTAIPNGGLGTAGVPSSLRGMMSSSGSHMLGQLIAINSGIPNDLDLVDALQGGLECDVDQVISHELSVDGNLDFIFPDTSMGSQDMSMPSAMAAAAAAAAANSGRHWVH